MNRKRVLAVTVIFLICATGAFALPDYSRYIRYYNSSGQQIGWRNWGCWGVTGSGSTSEIYSVYAADCETLESISCEVQELEQIPGCDMCVSPEYNDLFEQNVVPNPCA